MVNCTHTTPRGRRGTRIEMSRPRQAATNARVDLKIGFRCNNMCAFCVQGDKRDRFGPKGIEEIETALKEGRSRGAKGVVLTGGEPTIHETFLDTLRIAKRLGYATVQVQTNGRRFCYPDSARRSWRPGRPRCRRPCTALRRPSMSS